MYEVVKINFNGTPMKDVLRGSWQATVCRILNRNQKRSEAKAWQAIQNVATLGKDNWQVKAYRTNTRGVAVEVSAEFTVEIEQVKPKAKAA